MEASGKVEGKVAPDLHTGRGEGGSKSHLRGFVPKAIYEDSIGIIGKCIIANMPIFSEMLNGLTWSLTEILT